MESMTIAVDVAKNVFQVAVSCHPGKVSESHRLSRGKVLSFFAERQPALVVLEACGSAHYWGREIARLGHRVVLLPPGRVRPYVPRNKTDEADAKGLLEAHRNQEIRPVPVKSLAQQTLAGLHRVRSARMADRTRRLNLARGLLRELGLTVAVGARQVVPRVLALAEPGGEVPEPLRLELHAICEEIRELEKRIQETERHLARLARELPVVKRLQTIPGIGLLTATALVAFVGDIVRFPTSRHFASFLGLTPRERSSGGVRRLGRISKQGDRYLRTLLVHGARSALFAARRLSSPDRLRSWALHTLQSRGHNKAVVALANKLARIVWAVWRQATDYRDTVSRH